MTNPFSPTTGTTEYLDIRKRGNQLMIVKVWDHPEYVRTPHNKDGMVRINGREPFPNRAVRAAVVDLSAIGPDGQPGKLYPETWFQAASLMKDMKKWIGQLKLVTWLQDQHPQDAYGNPAQTNPYTITDHSGNADAVALAQEYLARHPEFHDIPAPAPYDGKPPVEVPAYAQQPRQGYPQLGYAQPPQQPHWQSAQQYPQAQPGYQQAPPPPQQQPAPWNTAAPPQGYYQQAPMVQQGPPQQQFQSPQTQAQPGSFFAAAQGQQAPQYPPQQGVNAQGWPQDQEPPF